jgi:hypothetical protein
VFTWAGVLGLALVVVSIAMFSIALANGIHCPHCDAQQLGERLAWWASYFAAKDVIGLASLPFSLTGVALGARRRWGLLGLVMGVLAVTITPR